MSGIARLGHDSDSSRTGERPQRARVARDEKYALASPTLNPPTRSSGQWMPR